MSSKTIFLNHHDNYDIGGKVFTLSELQDAVIKAEQRDELINDIKAGKLMFMGGK